MVRKEITRVGIWGTKAKGSVRNEWSFQLEKDHKLVKITIDHGECIHSLMFTTEDSKGQFHNSKKFGGWNGGATVFEDSFDHDEEMISINGTIGLPTVTNTYKTISSLSFVTNKRTHGPFGKSSGTSFLVPWDKGSFAGFYGLAGVHIYGIGVYLKTCQEIARVGTWGTKSKGGPQNQWSFHLEKNHKLKKITIDHGELIYSLMFTSEDSKGDFHTWKKVGGWNGGSRVSQVHFADQEELVGIEGTVAVSTGTYAGYTIISSLSFVTKQKTYGPFGLVKGTPFSVPWDTGLFAGFYGLAGYYLDSIGIYLKAAM